MDWGQAVGRPHVVSAQGGGTLKGIDQRWGSLYSFLVVLSKAKT